MEEAVRFNKDALIDELKQIHKDMVSVYTELFTYKYENNEDFRDFIEKEYRENGIGNDGKDKWNENFCHRTSYTLINKVLFIRICEDKGFMFNPEEDFIMGEPKDPNIGKKLSARGRDKWISLISNYTFGELLKFAFADMKESFKNIALFKEDKYEKLNPTKQELELKFMLDSKEYKKTPIYSYEENVAKIIEKLDTSKFDFNVPAEGNILGDVYEKFMDRETRKAIGQFYTPDFVIEYILNNTVAEADVVENPFVSVLDPACGSGHFLIMAYDILRKKFEESIDKLREKYADVDYVYKNEKMKGKEYWVKDRIHYHILKHCIFGADIDSFAVQLTTINLLLKDLDNFTDELNIMECDSLIKWEEDYDWQDLKQQLKNISMFYTINYKDINGIHRHDTLSRDKAEELVRLCEFWAKKYDYVVGNPPYGSRKRVDEIMKKYYGKKYFNEGDFDTYMFFLWRSVDLADKYISFITPNGYLTNIYNKILRNYLLNNVSIESIVNMKSYVFDDVNVDTIITIFSKNFKINNPIKIMIIRDFRGDILNSCFDEFYILQDNIRLQKNNMIYINNKESINLENILFEKSVKLREIGYCGQGIIVYGTKQESKEGKYLAKKISYDGNWKKTLKGRNTGYFTLEWNGLWLNYGPWLRRAREEKHLKAKKILIQRLRNANLSRRLVCTFDDEGYYILNNHNYVVVEDDNYDIYYILGILNSNLINYYYACKYTDVNIKEEYIRNIPIKQLSNKYQQIISNIVKLILGNLKISMKDYLLENLNKNGATTDNIFKVLKAYEDNRIEVDKNLLILNFIVYYIYGVENNIIINSEEHVNGYLSEEKSMLINSNIKSIDDLITNINHVYEKSLVLASNKIDEQLFYEEHILNNKSLEEICAQYGFEYATLALLRDKYTKIYAYNEPLKYYNLTELYKTINEYIKNCILEILSDRSCFIDLEQITKELYDKFYNFDSIINIMRKDNPTKKSKDIVKEALNQFADTWNSYIKKTNAGKEPKELVKYYDNNYYGLSEWDDEIHKEYFIDAIKEYTEINPNEKKARDILKLFEGLNIKDKEDYIEIFNSQIKKAFRK